MILYYYWAIRTQGIMRICNGRQDGRTTHDSIDWENIAHTEVGGYLQIYMLMTWITRASIDTQTQGTQHMHTVTARENSSVRNTCSHSTIHTVE